MQSQEIKNIIQTSKQVTTIQSRWITKLLVIRRVRLLSNYNIKYVCIIYTRLDTCLMSISRFSLRDKVTLRLLKLHCYGADVVEWSRALDIRLSDLWCSVSMV
jgi:hypothetical protein